MSYENALCADLPIELWFPPAFDENPTGRDSEYYDLAKMVCAECVHIDECRELGKDEKFGVWGGTSPLDRRRGSTVPPKRVLTGEAYQILADSLAHVDIPTIKVAVRKATSKRQSA